MLRAPNRSPQQQAGKTPSPTQPNSPAATSFQPIGAAAESLVKRLERYRADLLDRQADALEADARKLREGAADLRGRKLR